MSVINSMLKNIEQRNQQREVTNNQQGVVLQPVYDYRSITTKIIVACIAIAIIVWGYFYLTKQPEPTFVEAPHILQQSAPQPVKNEARIIEAQKEVLPKSNTEVTSASDNLDEAPAIVALQPDKNVAKAPITNEQKSKPTVAKTKQKPIDPAPEMVAKQLVQPSLEEQLAATLVAAKKALEFGLYQEAQSDLIHILQRAPAHIEARSLLAASYLQQQNIVAAQNTLEEGVAYDSQVLEWRVLLSKIIIKRHQYGAVLALLSDEFDSQATSQYWVLKGSAQQQLNKHQQALASFEHLTRSQPKQGKWWLAMATSKDALQDYYHAKQYYQAAIKTGGLSPTLLAHAKQRLQALQGVL